MNKNKKNKVQWETIGKVSVIVFALAVAIFFPFNKYFSGGKKAVQEEEQPDMTSALMEKEEEARDYNLDPEIYWRRDGDGYLLYVNGRQLTNTRSSWSGADLMVYDPATSTTYRLPNFKNLRDNQLREGSILRKGAGIMWKRTGAGENAFALYNSGVELGGLQTAWSNDDLLVYHASGGATYLLPNFKNTTDRELHEARLLSEDTPVFWRARKSGAEESYTLYVEGRQMTGLPSVFSGDDLIVTDRKAGRKYVLPGFKNRQDDQLRAGQIVQ